MPDIGEEEIEEEMEDAPVEPPAAVFSKKPKPKKDFGAALGIKKKVENKPVAVAAPPPAPANALLVAGYDSDDD